MAHWRVVHWRVMDGQTEFDVVVAGSGAAALSAALTAAVGGLSVLIVEKSDRIGGTSAMSGGGTWIPANHLAAAAGIADSAEDAWRYVRAASPDGWEADEAPLWRAFVAHAAPMLRFVEQHSPLRYELIDEPDPQAEQPGGKSVGRMVSPRPLSRRLVGRYARRIRRSTLPHIFSYREAHGIDPYNHPVRAYAGLAPTLLRRWLTDTRGCGTALIVGLLKGCLDAGARMQLGARVVGLLREPDGRVCGVSVEQDGRRRNYKAARGVVLATGGFEWDAAMRAAHFPGPLDRLGSPDTNTGDGQRLAAEAGARLERMDQANVYPTLPTRYDGRAHGMPMTWQAAPHSIVVDRTGRRFGSEYDYNLGEALDRRDASGAPLHLPAWLVGDARFLRRSAGFRWYARKERGWVRQAADLASLAAAIDVPAAALAATIARFNGFCAAGRDADYARGESVWERYKSGNRHGPGNPTLGAIERAPFVAVPLNRSILGTKGGARTDDRGRVLREDGGVIAGLYCAGNAMANPIGTRALGAGTTIGPCMTWGYLCARDLLGNAPA
ncbi:MAG TPA: FAD-dependent oxidoreductase [Acetobacteraceae bacterium]|nr:FAD-dependent oxidoreductase [Acetobacteraceae bacterium]